MTSPTAPTGDYPEIADVTIIGGGPSGLAAAYYAGHREASRKYVGGRLITGLVAGMKKEDIASGKRDILPSRVFHV